MNWLKDRKHRVGKISDEEVEKLQKECWKWFDGTALIGYWETADSYLFGHPDNDYVICISGNYMRRAIQHAKEKGGDETPFDPQPEG